MTEPLSLCASIAGLITIADIIFGRTYKFAKAVKRAPHEISALSSEISALYGTLQRLHLITCQFEEELFDSTARTEHLHSCYQTLEKIRARLGEENAPGVETKCFEKMTKKLRWPFTSSEVKVLISEIGRHKQTLDLALNVDNLSGLLAVLSRQQDIRDTVEDIRVLVKDRCEADTRIAMSNDRHHILRSFGKVDPQERHRMSRKLRHPTTGLWLTEGPEFQDWLTSVNARLWLYGIPGAGKTVLAALVIDEALRESNSNVAVAFFYCDYKASATQETHAILSSLAAQIAKQDEQSFEKLHKFYETHNPERRDDIKYDLESLRDLIIDLTSSFNYAMIIVDALDECGANTIQTVDVLASLGDNENINIRTLFLSRDEPDIRERLEHYTHIPIAARSSDLRLYVGAEIESRTRTKALIIKDNSLKECIMGRLVEGAEGMYVLYLYTYCIVGLLIYKNGTNCRLPQGFAGSLAR